MSRQSFWGNNHPLAEKHEVLHHELVPSSGPAPTEHGNLLRCMTNVYYDVYNNGFCNIKVYEDQLAVIQSAIPDLKAYMKMPQFWARNRQVARLAQNVGAMNRKQDEGEDLEEIEALEDLVASVILYVDAKEAERTDD